MAIVIQQPGSRGSYAMTAMSQIGAGYAAGKKQIAEEAESKAKVDYYKEQTREKKLKSDQVEAYNLAVGNLGKETGIGGEGIGMDGGFHATGPYQRGAHKNTILWRSDVATKLREAQESREGAYPEEIMGLPSVQEAWQDAEAVARAQKRSLLRHPEARIEAQDDQAYQDALERQLRHVTSVMNRETARIFDRDKSQFVSEVLAVKDDQLDAIYGDKLRELVQKIETEGGGGSLMGLKTLTNLRDEFYEQASKKEDYAKWAAQANDYIKSPEAIAALTKHVSEELQLTGEGLTQEADKVAMKMLRSVSLDTLTDVEANNPAEAAEAYTTAQDNWNKIQMAVGGIEGITTRQYEARAENMERQWQAAVGFQTAFSNDQEDAKSLIAQLQYLKTRVDVPPQLTGKEAASYRVEMAATELNMALLDQNKSTLPTRFLHALLGQDLGDYSIHQVSDENWLLKEDRPPLIGSPDKPGPDSGDAGTSAETTVGKLPEHISPMSPEGKAHYAKAYESQEPYRRDVEKAATLESTRAAVAAKARYDTVNPREEEGAMTAFTLWNERAVPMDQTEKQIDAYVAAREKRLEKEFQEEKSPQWFGMTTLSGNTAELRRATAALRGLSKERRLMWLLKAEEQLIDTPRDYTSHLGSYSGDKREEGMDLLRGLAGMGQGGLRAPLSSEIDTHDVTILANRLRTKGVSKPSGATSLSAEQEARRGAIRQQK